MATLGDLIRTYQNRTEDMLRLSCAELSALVITRTPVDTGVLQNSWTAAKNTIDFSNRGGNFVETANSLDLGDTYSLGNGQPYVGVIEYEGHSQQAPAGMLRVSTAEWDDIVARNIR